jgi:Restriction endonuclease
MSTYGDKSACRLNLSRSLSPSHRFCVGAINNMEALGNRTMPNLHRIDMLLVDELFEQPGNPGYVLDFSNSTFAIFFAEELGIDIDDPVYARNGTSKGKRLRCFLNTVDMATAIKTLKALWEYREANRLRGGYEDTVRNAQGRFLQLIGKLEGRGSGSGASPRPAFDRQKFSELHLELMDLANLASVPRGYAFEKYLKRLFDAFGLEARAPFKLIGEQIDGSFALSGETYLLEARWQNEVSAVADLHAFHGKCEQKATWARGLFVSYSGFSEQGLQAFGRGKRIICLDGLDLSEALKRELPLNTVLERKVRHAAETGVTFVRVRDLF